MIKDRPSVIDFNSIKEKGDLNTEVIAHLPESQEKRSEINKIISKIHAHYIEQYLKEMNCPIEQKLRLIDKIAEMISLS